MHYSGQDVDWGGVWQRMRKGRGHMGNLCTFNFAMNLKLF